MFASRSSATTSGGGASATGLGLGGGGSPPGGGGGSGESSRRSDAALEMSEMSLAALHCRRRLLRSSGERMCSARSAVFMHAAPPFAPDSSPTAPTEHEPPSEDSSSSCTGVSAHAGGGATASPTGRDIGGAGADPCSRGGVDVTRGVDDAEGARDGARELTREPSREPSREAPTVPPALSSKGAGCTADSAGGSAGAAGAPQPLCLEFSRGRELGVEHGRRASLREPSTCRSGGGGALSSFSRIRRLCG